jgi:hypothetical protein
MTDEIKDKAMTCADCGRVFNWTVRDQHVSASQASERTTLCYACAQARKSKHTRESWNQRRTPNKQ